MDNMSLMYINFVSIGEVELRFGSFCNMSFSVRISHVVMNNISLVSYRQTYDAFLAYNRDIK